MKVPVENGIPGWSRAALEVLSEVAGMFNATITSTELAEEAQVRSGRRANVASKAWVTKVLAVVTLKCQREGWPHLVSLVLRPSDGRIGPWYQNVIALTGPGSASDEHHHAAQMRLECYRAFGADVQEGAVATIRSAARCRRRTDRASRAGTSSGPASRSPHGEPGDGDASTKASRRRPQASGERTGGICPTCFMQTPLTGECPTCA